jgi:hypothetical protein
MQKRLLTVAGPSKPLRPEPSESGVTVGTAPAARKQLFRVSGALAIFGLVYTLYRGYYGFGGTIGMIGTPASESEWRAQNLGAAAVLLLVSLLPLVALPFWRHPRLRRALLVVAWLLAVGGVMHALIMDVQRGASLAGLHDIDYPASEWQSLDDHAADLQDLFFNETWFLVEGLLWGALAWTVLGRSRGGRRWLTSALTATAALTCIGLLSGFGVVGRAVVG